MRRNILNNFFYLLLTGILLLLPSVCQADKKIRILSSYVSNDNPTPNFHIWDVHLKVSPDNHVSVFSFYPENADSNSICEIEISGLDKKNIFFRTGDNQMQTENGLFIFSEISVPCNILPVNQSEKEKIYTQKRIAGGRVFSRKFKIIRKNFDVDTCLKNGWIKKKDNIIKLTMFIVESDNQVILKQLWNENDKWWLYEETGSRRSWQLP